MVHVGSDTSPTELFIPREFENVVNDGFEILQETLRDSETVLGAINAFL
jgi:hypothetical protein